MVAEIIWGQRQVIKLIVVVGVIALSLALIIQTEKELEQCRALMGAMTENEF